MFLTTNNLFILITRVSKKKKISKPMWNIFFNNYAYVTINYYYYYVSYRSIVQLILLINVLVGRPLVRKWLFSTRFSIQRLRRTHSWLHIIADCTMQIFDILMVNTVLSPNNNKIQQFFFSPDEKSIKINLLFDVKKYNNKSFKTRRVS